jgi:hypothetical protein
MQFSCPTHFYSGLRTLAVRARLGGTLLKPFGNDFFCAQYPAMPGEATF